MLFPGIPYEKINASIRRAFIDEVESDLELVDRVDVVAASSGQGELTAPVQAITFGATGDGSEQHPINGTDGDELIWIGKLNLDTGAFNLRFEPNDLNADDFGLEFSGRALLQTDFPGLRVMNGLIASGPMTLSFECAFHGYDGEIRVFRLSEAILRLNGTSTNANNYNLRKGFTNWEDLVTVLDRVRFFIPEGARILAGSYIKMYRLKGEL